jgi:predicted Zn-dependent peptidase
LNTLLGGSFTSRLNQNLREEHGWTYGARSRFLRFARTGHFSAQAALQTSATAEGIGEMLKELRRLRDEPVPAAELEKGRRQTTYHLLLRSERADGLAQLYGDIARYGLPLDELALLQRDLRRTTAKELQQVARRYLLPDTSAIVVVGDQEKFAAQLRKLLGL